MNHTWMNWMAALWMASMLAWIWTLAGLNRDGRRQGVCPRKGCRRMPAGHGCNHAAACDGSQARQFTSEED